MLALGNDNSLSFGFRLRASVLTDTGVSTGAGLGHRPNFEL